jgi:hypothetical protein
MFMGGLMSNDVSIIVDDERNCMLTAGVASESSFMVKAETEAET